jgi:hypothetical protein
VAVKAQLVADIRSELKSQVGEVGYVAKGRRPLQVDLDDEPLIGRSRRASEKGCTRARRRLSGRFLRGWDRWRLVGAPARRTA